MAFYDCNYDETIQSNLEHQDDAEAIRNLQAPSDLAFEPTDGTRTELLDLHASFNAMLGMSFASLLGAATYARQVVSDFELLGDQAVAADQVLPSMLEGLLDTYAETTGSNHWLH